MDFTSLDELQVFCERMASGTLVNLDEIDSAPLRLTPEEAAVIPKSFRPWIDLWITRDDEMRKKLLLATTSVQALASAVSFLAAEIRRLRGESQS